VLNPFKRKLSENEVSSLLAEHQPVGLIAGVEPLTASVLQATKGLRVVSRCGTGLDSVDLSAASELGINVFNTPDAPTSAVAELTIGLILDLIREISAVSAAVKQGNWYRPTGRLLSAMTVGIVGCGRIGGAVAARLDGFGCRLIGCDPALREHGKIELMALDKLLLEADLVTLHVPGGDAAKPLIDQKRLSLMKPGAFLVNAARGDLIDEDSLANALREGHLSGAAIDCFLEEPYSGPLTDCPNAILTAHIGSYAKETRGHMELEAVENLLKGLKEGQSPCE